MTTYYTCGTSTHPLSHFVGLLHKHGVTQIADVRSYPTSSRYPAFNRHSLSKTVEAEGIRYEWIEQLGGRRNKQPNAGGNLGLRHASFRNYADYMQLPNFEAGLQRLKEISIVRPTVYICAEALFWKCHRKLISDALFVAGEEVLHIFPDGTLKPHKPMREMHHIGGKIQYEAV